MKKKTMYIIIFKIIFYVCFILIVIPYLLSRKITNIPRRDDFDNPANYNIEYEDVVINTKDKIKLSCWYIKSKYIKATKKTVILVHGYGDFKDAFLSRALFLKNNGYNVFLYDGRAHGQSEGKLCTMGYKETQDLIEVISYVREKDKGHKIYLWGVSLGASVSLLAAAQDKNVSGVIAESPFVSLRETIAHHAKLYYHVPKFPLIDITLFIFCLRTGAVLDRVDVKKAMSKLKSIPVFFIAGEADKRMLPKRVKALYKVKSGIKDMWVAPGADHLEAYEIAGKVYEKKILDFLR
jgi:pimeloyl-ACP methyl ester carboxylesterase